MKKTPRVSKTGLMGSATRVHRPGQGVGSYRRRDKFRKNFLDNSQDNE